MNGNTREGPYAANGKGGRDPATSLLNTPFYQRAGLMGIFRARLRVVGSGAWAQQPLGTQASTWSSSFGSVTGTSLEPRLVNTGAAPVATGMAAQPDAAPVAQDVSAVAPHGRGAPTVFQGGPMARKAAPTIRPYTRGSASMASAIVSSSEEFETAAKAFQDAKHANSSRGGCCLSLEMVGFKGPV